MPSRNLLLRALGSAIDEIKDHLTPLRLAAGQQLTEPGQDVEAVIFPVSGLVSARAVFETGQEVECLLVGRNGAVGALAAFGLRTALTRDICLIAGDAWKIPVASLQAAAHRVAGIQEALSHCARSQMAYAVRLCACNSVHLAERRLARWLLTACHLLEGDEIVLRQDEVASALGLQRTVVNPLLQRFQGQGLMTIHRGRLAISDAAGMRRRACECHPAIERTLAGLRARRD